jgi:hypothetical protein
MLLEVEVRMAAEAPVNLGKEMETEKKKTLPDSPLPPINLPMGSAVALWAKLHPLQGDTW